jgi:hypothetical protein
LAVEKSISGISRTDALDGPRCLVLRARFIVISFVPRCSPRVDDSRFVVIDIHKHDYQNAPSGRQPDDQRPTESAHVIDDLRERICEYVTASSNVTWCLRAFKPAFRKSQLKRILVYYFFGALSNHAPRR